MNSKFIENLLIVILILLLQVLVYSFFIKPVIIQWGATQEETSMSMIGDTPDLEITSTRAIVINAPKDIVWKWLMQLGANKKGFYSFDMITQNLENKNQSIFEDFKVGDIIYGSVEKENSSSSYTFKVLSLKAKESFVLENWGTFLIKSISDKQTRLIIRTQATRGVDLLTSFKNQVMIPLHFIMERQMFFGLKFQSEKNKNVKIFQNKDIVWLVSVFILLCIILSFFVLAKGIYLRTIITSFLSFLWMYIVFI